MESYVLGRKALVNDLIEKCEESKKLFVFSGRRPKLGFQPHTSLKLHWGSDNIVEEIKNFCQNAQEEKRLVIGLLSYDLGLYLHNLNPENKTDLPLAELYSFDNWIEENDGKTIVKYCDESFLEDIASLARQPNREVNSPPADFSPYWNLEYYKKVFNKAKEYIRSGDIYQINLSYPLTGVCKANAKDIFALTNKVNQASMAGLFQAEDFDAISLSPETFINITGNNIETFPIKGTRARGEHKNDVQIEDSLMHDEKEQAELNMISDLLRNDLSMVCEPNSVKLRSRRNTAKLSRVIHTYSHITGNLADGISSIDALLKIFPGGSISGCPKKRALEIIDELEEYARGPYTGSLFTLDPEDNLEASILIRTLIKRGTSLSLPVGGGIVVDSKYSAEYQETLDKAVSITQVFNPD